MPTTMITLRVPDELLRRLDRHTEQLEASTGLTVTRTAAALRLLAAALDLEERRVVKPRKK